MKRTFLPLLLCLLNIVAFAQHDSQTRALVVQGKLTNSPERYLLMWFKNEHGNMLADTIKLNADGSFMLKTYKIKKPQLVSIQRNQTQINNIYMAPGYDLHISGDASSFQTLFKTTTITGRGAEINRYRQLLNEYYAKHMNETPWYELKAPQLLTYAKAQHKTKDSIANLVFGGKPITDAYFRFFKEMVFMDNQFTHLYYILSYANMHKLPYEESQNFVNNNFDKRVLNDLNNESNLISKDFKTWALGEYTNYRLNLDFMRDSTLRKKKGYRLIKMDEIYKGPVKEYVLFNQMEADITFAKNLERLNYCKDMFKPYIAKLTDTYYAKLLNEQFAKKEAELTQTAIGKPAPNFTLASNNGKTVSLTDFKGKVVFIDLWASWCGPCRAETPHLASLYDKYKNDSRIAFVSVAVSDGQQQWLDALAKDKPTWLQLIDKDDAVRSAYVANMIPQFVIVNKQGHIVNFNAPEPSSGQKLEDILLKEMNIE